MVLEKYARVALDSFWGYGDYLFRELLHPHPTNYVYWLLAVSLVCWLWEILFPWRKRTTLFREDFWLDAFYMVFNFFLFSLVGYNALSNVAVAAFQDGLASLGIHQLVVWDIAHWPLWACLLTLFVVRDFIQWNVHRLLHRVDWLWRFHQVHHSTQEMGFAAHLRYHPMETLVYRTIEYVPLAMIGFGLTDFFLVHLFTLSIGHLNHSNVYLPLGKLGYLLNNPQAHTWHHARELPEHPYGVNYGITLNLWDCLFGTFYQPRSGESIPLGLKLATPFPRQFLAQMTYPFRLKKRPHPTIDSHVAPA
jgi:sterol desaturase/sphingolipid hydroxylase (fatty acid hydroxylase superfamily)